MEAGLRSPLRFVSMGRADAVYWGSKYNVDLFFSALARRAPRVVTQPLSQPAPLRRGPFFNRPIFLPPTP